MPKTRSQRIAELKRQIAAADRTGQAYSRIASAIAAMPLSNDNSAAEREVVAQEVARYNALVDEMMETSVSLSCDLAEWEQGL